MIQNKLILIFNKLSIPLYFLRSPRCRQYMGKWNLRLDDNLVELEARTLEPETITYSDRAVRYKQQEADWSRDGKSRQKKTVYTHLKLTNSREKSSTSRSKFAISICLKKILAKLDKCFYNTRCYRENIKYRI